MNIATILIAIIGSSAVWGFAQFLIQRKDTKDDKLNKILESQQQVSDKLTEMHTKLDIHSEVLNIISRNEIQEMARGVVRDVKAGKKVSPDFMLDLIKAYKIYHIECKQNGYTTHLVAKAYNAYYERSLTDEEFLKMIEGD